MLTAQEAHAVASKKTVQQVVEDVIERIAKAAESHLFTITIRDEFFARGGYTETPEYVEAIGMLRDLGYQVKYFWDCGQFVDSGIFISWEDVK